MVPNTNEPSLNMSVVKCLQWTFVLTEEFTTVILRDTLKCGPVSEISLKLKRYGHLSFCFPRSKVTDKGKAILDISILHNRLYIIRVKVSPHDSTLF